jgi:CheY-like chemotaxis protein
MAQCIAMIDDDREMVMLGRMILEREGYEVISAHTGPEGLEMLQQRDGKVDLILLDVMMFGMDGWQVLGQIRKDEKLGSIPVIMLTARKYIEDESAAKGYSGMFQGYLTKPFVVRELLSKIESVLETET